jgi:hypothetical protein
LLWLVKGYGNAARCEVDAGRQVLELLRHDPNRGFDQKLGTFPPLPLQLRQDFGYAFPALDFVVALIPLSDAA